MIFLRESATIDAKIAEICKSKFPRAGVALRCHMTCGAHLCGEPSVADVALKRPLLGVRPDVDFQCRVAGKHFETDLGSWEP